MLHLSRLLGALAVLLPLPSAANGLDDFLTFIAHQSSEHHETASPALGSVIEAIKLEWVDPVQGASTFVPTVSQAAPEDADELTKKYAVRFAAEIADWWLPLRSGAVLHHDGNAKEQ